ncbi:MAG: HEAT repeat domain-containing protein [Luteolibacter sp.]|uniref:NACHT domain-containing protein n=1 Tax=Luteolibacter sp. TaxID=1962973 RepID=UPI00326516AC
MTIIGEILLPNLLAYLINIASGERSAAMAATRDAKLKGIVENDDALRKALISTHSIRDEVRGACAELARNRDNLGVPAHEEPLWQLLSDDVFQADLIEWLMAGAIDEGYAVKGRLLQTMETALASGGASSGQIRHFATGYFESVDKAIFAHPVLAHWRQQLSLDYLRGQVTVLRKLAEEAAGVYPPARQKVALDRYCEKALASWDIIDLSNLPEGDVQITTQQLLLRQLYMPLRIEVEPSQRGEDADAALARLEQGREDRRHREAGHFVPDELTLSDLVSGEKSRSPIGERLGVSRRLVVLGDPGGGKTTMLRWMATAYLLRHNDDAAFSMVPDTDTLPGQPWIPVFIRCRELGEVDLCRCFTDFLTQHLNKTELLPDEASIMRAVILDRIAKGEALLLVDGLDEITNPQVRMQFCQELERTAARYPNAPIVVTSRIVGYRDMPYRMGSGFEHCVIAELNRQDKDLFAKRWVEVTEQHQPTLEKTKRVQELIEALHSSDRIERLTGNPMLLTTLALVKRKVGKLPNRRTKLYAEAVSVLLNWNPRLYLTIEEDEAIPQLEYLAYEMCRRGVQRMTDDEVLELLDNLRVEYPKIRSVRSRDPREFLKHLEQRSSILIRSGGAWQKNNPTEKPVWEFRHLTFQEYLAARALLDGRYPGRGKPKSLAEQVAPLAGAMETVKNRASRRDGTEEHDVPESWREALRLLVSDCKDDDVDDVLLAILNPMDGEDAVKTGRPRAVLAALCLADEPNVSEENAQKAISVFTSKVGEEDGTGRIETPLARAAMEVGASIWCCPLRQSLVDEFFTRSAKDREGPGALLGMIEVVKDGSEPAAVLSWVRTMAVSLKGADSKKATIAALGLTLAAFRRVDLPAAKVIPGLLGLLGREQPVAHAASWALQWLSGGKGKRNAHGKPLWNPTDKEFSLLAHALVNTPEDSAQTKICLINTLAKRKNVAGYAAIIKRLDDPDAGVRQATARALVPSGGKQAVAPLVAMLDDQDAAIRKAVIVALGQLGDKKAAAPLVAKLADQNATIRKTVIAALAQLGDKQAVAPLVAMLDDQDAGIRKAVIAALAQLGDKQAVAPLVAMLDAQDAAIRKAVIVALGQLGDKQAAAPLVAKLDDLDASIRSAAAVGLHTLGEPKGIAALTRFLASDDFEIRQAAVRAYAQQNGSDDKLLLSRDLDGSDPWLDPKETVSEVQADEAASRLAITPEQVRSRFEALAGELNLKLDWKP